MATGADMVYGALRKLGVRTAESPIEDFEMSDGIETLNDMLSEWDGRGIKLGFTPIDNSSDTIRVPRMAHDCIKSNLAIRLAPDYEKPVSAELAATAVSGTDSLLISTVHLEVDYPDTLPKGTGNYTEDFEDERFFDGSGSQNF
jgi:hypothetical protein